MREEFLNPPLRASRGRRRDEFPAPPTQLRQDDRWPAGRQGARRLQPVPAKADAERLFADLIKVRATEKAMTEGELLSGLDG